MHRIDFSWDLKKAQANVAKHGLTFDEAKTVFFDADAVQFFDSEHSGDEDRFLMLGMSSHLRLLMVAHTYDEDAKDTDIRIISARLATPKERKHYRRDSHEG